jgi:V/A-type H+-transporting ATPase subunit E
MAGVDNIINEILQEANDKAAGILDEAKKKAAEIENAAQKESADAAGRAAQKAELDAEEYARRSDSASQMLKKKAILSAKQDIITEVIKKAYQKLDQQPDDAYFEMIRTLLKKAVHEGDGEICFSARDLKRLPKNFEQDAKKIAAGNGGSLKLSKEPADIENGFILRYGGIEENCTLTALFEEKSEQLRDKVHQVLW